MLLIINLAFAKLIITKQQKSTSTLLPSDVLLQICEASMKQNPIPSQTTSRLYQHPTVEEQRPSRFATIKANVIDFLIFIALSFVLWVIAVGAASWMMGG